MEQWRDIAGYEGLYQVSNIGRVRSLDREINHPNNGQINRIVKRGRIIKVRQNKYRNGYVEVTLTNSNGKPNTHRVHRFVALAFIPNLNGKPEVNHIDGNTENNTVENLEWVTRSENLRHAFNVLGVQRKSQMKHIRITGGDNMAFVLPHQHYAAKLLQLKRGTISMALAHGWKAGGYSLEFAA